MQGSHTYSVLLDFTEKTNIDVLILGEPIIRILHICVRHCFTICIATRFCIADKHVKGQIDVYGSASQDHISSLKGIGPCWHRTSHTLCHELLILHAT